MNILTITLNPAVDKSATADNIQPEKKLRCSKPHYEPGGGGINVSRGLLRLGVPSVAFFPSGGRTGERLESLLAGEKVTAHPFHITAETRENFSITDTSDNRQFRFGMPGEEITPAEQEALLNAITAISPFPEIAVISGSLPPGMEVSFFTKLIKTIKAKNARIILDTSGDALKAAVDEGVFLLKPNLGELGRLAGKEALDNELADEAAKKLIEDGRTEMVVVSMGPQGAYLVTREENIHVPAPSVKKLSTVGAGDSMVAGMVAVLAKNGSPKKMAQMGVACGTAATMSAGTGLFRKEDAEKLYKWLSR